MTIPTAVARVAFLAMNSGEIDATGLEDLKKRVSGGSTKRKIGIRIAAPARFNGSEHAKLMRDPP